MSNIVGVISSTWTVIKLPPATLLYSSTFSRVGVSKSAPNGCLSRAMSFRARIRFAMGDTDDGGRSDAVSSVDVLSHPPNRPRRATSRAARVCRAVDVVLEGPGKEGNSPSTEDWSSIFFSGNNSGMLPTGCRSRRKSIQG